MCSMTRLLMSTFSSDQPIQSCRLHIATSLEKVPEGRGTWACTMQARNMPRCGGNQVFAVLVILFR